MMSLKQTLADASYQEAVAAHERVFHEGGHAWMYEDVNKALRAVGYDEDMLKPPRKHKDGCPGCGAPCPSNGVCPLTK